MCCINFILGLKERIELEYNTLTYKALFQVHEVSLLNCHSHKKVTNKRDFYYKDFKFSFEEICNNFKFCCFSYFLETLISLISELWFS